MTKSTDFVARVRKVIPLDERPERYHTIFEWDSGVLVTALPFELEEGQALYITIAEFKEPDRCAE